MTASFPYIWSWGTSGSLHPDSRPRPGLRPELGKRKGQRCRVVARGAKNSVMIEFGDGYWTITSGNGLRREK